MIIDENVEICLQFTILRTYYMAWDKLEIPNDVSKFQLTDQLHDYKS